MSTGDSERTAGWGGPTPGPAVAPPGAHPAGGAPPAAQPALSLAERLRLLGQAAANQAGLIAALGAGLLVVPVMLHHFGAEQYGLWLVAFATPAPLAALGTPLYLGITREVSGRGKGPLDAAARELLGASLGAWLALGLAGGAFTLLAGTVLAPALRLGPGTAPLAAPVFAWVALDFLAYRVAAFGNAVLAGLGRFGTINALAATAELLRVGGIVLVARAGLGLRAAVAVPALLSVAAAIVGLALVRRATGFRPGRSLVRWGTLRRRAAFGLWSLLADVAHGAFWAAPALLVGALRGATANVPLHLGLRPATVASELSWRGAEVLFPASAPGGQEGSSRLGELALFGARWTLAVAVPIATALAVLAHPLLALWVGEVPAGADLVLRLACAGIVADALLAGPLHVLWGAGAARAVFVVAASQLAVSVGLALLLVPGHGAPGAAVAFGAGAWAGAGLALAAGRSLGAGLGPMAARVVRPMLLPAAAGAAATWLAARPFAGRPLFAVLAGTAAGTVTYAMLWARTAGREERQAIAAAAWGSMAEQAWRALRGWLRGVPAVRSAYGCWRTVVDVVRRDDAEGTERWYREEFEGKVDPWNYLGTEEQERHARAARLLDGASAGGTFGRALEIGCAEGVFTAQLAGRCASLRAVDISEVALGRARERCRDLPGVEFASWNMRRDPMPPGLDLLVIMDVLDNFGPLDIRRVRGKLVGGLAAGGHLLVGNTKRGAQIESAAWGRWLPIGAAGVNRFMGSHADLVHVATEGGPFYVLSLYRKRTR